MTHIDDLIHPEVLAADNEAGYIREQQHPNQPLRILNYTEKAQFNRHWTAATLQCRGLIVTERGEVVARPFPKFFNHDQPEGAFSRKGEVTVVDKLDGSLGILYGSLNGFAIATRGSFASDQAVHATEVYRKKYADLWTPPLGYTILFEIIYPDNRIVVDYGHRDDLVLLGAVDNATGRIVSPNFMGVDSWWGWPGPRAEVFSYTSWAEALAMRPRGNAEGVVVRFHDSNQMVKIKQDDYVALHRIVTGWNERTVWQHLRDGGTVDGLADNLPDEFHDWAKSVAAGLDQAHADRSWAALKDFAAITERDWPSMARKDFALKASKSPNAAALFLIFDGAWQRYDAWVWDQIKPTSKEVQLA